MEGKKRRGYKPLLAGVQGFEPQLTDPESAVLPLNDTPLSLQTLYHVREVYNTASRRDCQALRLANLRRFCNEKVS
jgi:hypothetical protein